MIWLNVLGIVVRILFGLCCIGFVLGMTLWNKHPIFENIAVSTGFLIMGYGFSQMLVYAILGC